MKLIDILDSKAVCGDLHATDKKGVLSELAAHVAKVYPDLGAEEVLRVLLEREKLGSTGVGNGVSIPHGKIATLKKIVTVFGRSKRGIDFQSHDHKSANLFFVLLAPENVVGNHLQALARLSRLLKDESIRSKLLEVDNRELFDLLISEDNKL